MKRSIDVAKGKDIKIFYFPCTSQGVIITNSAKGARRKTELHIYLKICSIFQGEFKCRPKRKNGSLPRLKLFCNNHFLPLNCSALDFTKWQPSSRKQIWIQPDFPFVSIMGYAVKSKCLFPGKKQLASIFKHPEEQLDFLFLQFYKCKGALLILSLT